MISLCCAYAFLIKRWWRLWHGDKILWIERIIMAVEGGDNMSFLINKPFLIKMLQKNSAALLLSILYFHHHEMAVLPSQPEQCLLDWNIHGSYMGGRKKPPKKPSERASQWHSCRDELQHLSNCGMKVSSVSLVVRPWGRRKACDHFIFKDVTFRRRPCNGESDVVDRETSHKVWQVGGESEEACFVFQSSFSSRAQSARRSLFESSVHFLLRLKKHTRDYVGVVQVRHDLLSLSLLWEGWKVLLRYSSTAHKSRRAFWEATRTVKCLSWSSGSQGFRATSRWRQTAAEQSPPPPTYPSLGPDNTSPVKRALGCSPPAFTDDPLMLCWADWEWRGLPVAASGNSIRGRCICVHQIAALGLACKMKTGGEALNERRRGGGALCFQWALNERQAET